MTDISFLIFFYCGIHTHIHIINNILIRTYMNQKSWIFYIWDFDIYIIYYIYTGYIYFFLKGIPVSCLFLRIKKSNEMFLPKGIFKTWRAEKSINRFCLTSSNVQTILLIQQIDIHTHISQNMSILVINRNYEKIKNIKNIQINIIKILILFQKWS